jgi:hypothetical protein
VKWHLAALTTFLVLAVASAIGTDAPVELQPRTGGDRQAALAAKISTCGDMHEFLKSRLFYIEKEIGLQSRQQNAWRAFSDAAQVAQDSLEPACREQADPIDSEYPIEAFSRPDRTSSATSDALQLFDGAAKAFVDVLTPLQLQKFSETLWLFVRSQLERERSEIEIYANEQLMVAMLDSAAGVQANV